MACEKGTLQPGFPSRSSSPTQKFSLHRKRNLYILGRFLDAGQTAALMQM